MTNDTRRGRRDEIREVAQKLFRDKGYLATSMRDIADEMNMKGGGSLYAHIKGKEDLLWEIAIEAIDAFFGALTPIMEQNNPANDKLRQAMIAHILVITTHLGGAIVYFDEWKHLTEPRLSEFISRRDSYEKMFQRLIHQGITESTFRPIDERLATLHVLSAINAVRRWYKPTGRLSDVEVATAVADMVLNGLR
jgi:TetR/AcrR family transcriptional regulator, cholesterol catabolism regulator